MLITVVSHFHALITMNKILMHSCEFYKGVYFEYILFGAFHVNRMFVIMAVCLQLLKKERNAVMLLLLQKL